MSMMIAIANVPGVAKAGRTYVDSTHADVKRFPHAWKPAPGRKRARGAVRSRVEPLDVLTELQVREQTIAEIEEAERIKDRARKDEQADAFWRSTARFLDRLDSPNADRERRELDEIEAVIAAAQAAPMREVLDEICGGAGPSDDPHSASFARPAWHRQG
jgi:hypothetical protein